VSPIDLDPVSGSEDAYLSAEEADAFALRVADTAAWAAADDDLRSAVLLQASDELDTLRFAGARYEATQAREFPRWVGGEPPSWPATKQVETPEIWDWDEETEAAVVPERVKFAAFLQALSILRDPARMERLRDRHDGVTAQAAGGVSESYDPGRRASLVSLEATKQLRPYLLVSGRTV
jgi:hypothetical protein